MRAELASIRKLLQHQVSGLMWQEVERREPTRALIIKQLTQGGFEPAYAEHLASLIPEEVSLHEAWQRLKEGLVAELKTGDDDILRHGGAVALLHHIADGIGGVAFGLVGFVVHNGVGFHFSIPM